MGKKNIILISTILVFFAIGLIGGSLAYFTTKDDILNVIPVGSVSLLIEEEFTEDAVISNGGVAVNKDVHIENNGTGPALMRVALTPRWVNTDGTSDFLGNVNTVVLNLEPNATSKWFYGNDGYYYYKEVVAPGTKTIQLLDSVTIPANQDIGLVGKKLIVDVRAEAIQPHVTVLKNTWNIEDQDILNVLEPLCDGK